MMDLIPMADDHLASALEHLETLIAFNTVSSRSNLPLIAYCTEILEQAGAVIRCTESDDGAKRNLFASIGPSVPGGVVLSGHTDVVPVDGQSWTADPFRLKRRDDRLYGRGTADMKAFIACCLAIAPLARSSQLRHPVHFAFSYDEELGCLGAPRMIEDLRHVLPQPAFAIVGEPTSMEIVTAHKGCCAFETCFVGKEAHSSQSQLGTSAIIPAADFICHLRDRFAALAASPSSTPGLEPPVTTFNVGIIDGGAALNIIPKTARVVWEFRPVPEHDSHLLTRAILAHIEDHILPGMRQANPEARIDTRQIAYVPALVPADNRALRDMLSALTGLEGDGTVAFGTEAGLFQSAGIPTVVCGPGSIAQAHQPDEYVDIAQLPKALLSLEKIIQWAAT
jgi:acetylornithine deacetylase